MVQLLQHKV